MARIGREGRDNRQAESLIPWGWTTIQKGILCFWVRDGGTLMILLLYAIYFGGCFFMVLESCACSVNALLLRCTLPPTWALCPGFHHRLKSVERFVGFFFFCFLGWGVEIVFVFSQNCSLSFWQLSLRHLRLFPLSTSTLPLSGK